jgi:hypothetical protein
MNAEKLVNLLFPFDEFDARQIPLVALHAVECMPTLKGATQDEKQHVANLLCAALSDLQIARRVARAARYIV